MDPVAPTDADDMTIARATRWLLALAALLVVVWAFADVGYRSWVRRNLAHHDPRTELTIQHWVDNAEIAIVRALVS